MSLIIAILAIALGICYSLAGLIAYKCATQKFAALTTRRLASLIAQADSRPNQPSLLTTPQQQAATTTSQTAPRTQQGHATQQEATLLQTPRPAEPLLTDVVALSLESFKAGTPSTFLHDRSEVELKQNSSDLLNAYSQQLIQE